MNKLGNITQLLTYLRRFHMIIFFVTIMVGLSTAVLLLYGIFLKTSSPPPSSANSTKSSFDEATINRINQLKTSSDPSTPLDFSQGRISPFSE